MSHGKPLPGTTMNATDLIATVAGVNFATVAKVVAAIASIELHTDYSLHDLLDVEGIPDGPAETDDRMIPDGYMVDLAQRIVQTLPRRHVVAMRLYRFLPAANSSTVGIQARKT